MFRRKNGGDVPPESGTDPAFGLHREFVQVADQDSFGTARMRGLLYQQNLGMQGHSGYVVGYDQGDPASSFMAVVDKASTSPISANARVGIADGIALNPIPEYTTVPSADIASGESYLALLWNRIDR